jgi:UDP-N-acetylmuramyl pentapeptide phosphotransferase/UDP-N-acetylglucosamine-1-phosphate transferase
MFLIIVAITACSFVVSMLIIRYAYLHKHVTSNHPANGPQQSHIGITPRIGGIPLILGVFLGLPLLSIKFSIPWQAVMLWLAAAAPVFLAGLAEDFTNRIGPRWRLLAAFVSAAIGVWALGARFTHLDIVGIDQLLKISPLFCIALTVFAVAGVCHSMNIIDGYNGLVGGVSCIILIALGYTSWKVGDVELYIVCIAAVAAVVGFLFWNYPRGLIFAGDSGAYLLGFIIAEVSVLLVARHPQVSPWFPLMLVIYPVWETIFSIYRRKIIKGHSSALPDALHLHQILFSRVVRWMVGRQEAKNLLKRNSLTTPYLWGMGIATVCPALIFWQNSLALQFCCLCFAVMYVWLYSRIVRFKSPRWMVLRSKRAYNRHSCPR